MSENRKKPGRPSSYTPQLGIIICARMSAGMSLRNVCRQKDMPSMSMVQRWVYQHPEFREQYTRAMEARGCAFGERSAEIAERVLAGELAPDAGRVAMQGFQWAAARMAPKVFGDRVALTGAGGGPIKHEHVSIDDLDKAIAELERRAVEAHRGQPAGDGGIDREAQAATGAAASQAVH